MSRALECCWFYCKHFGKDYRQVNFSDDEKYIFKFILFHPINSNWGVHQRTLFRIVDSARLVMLHSDKMGIQLFLVFYEKANTLVSWIKSFFLYNTSISYNWHNYMSFFIFLQKVRSFRSLLKKLIVTLKVSILASY